MEQYCNAYVNAMGIDAEGPLVYLGILFKCLDCYGVIIHLDRRDDVSMNAFENDLVKDRPALGTVHLYVLHFVHCDHF